MKGGVLFGMQGIEPITNATVRWTVADTSANTGVYINFCQRQKCKSIPLISINKTPTSSYEPPFLDSIFVIWYYVINFW